MAVLGCTQEPPAFEAISLLGDTLRAPAPNATGAARADSLSAASTSPLDSIIWQGRRAAYLGEYQRAIATYSEGLARFPEDPRLLRHRGHRWITVRRLDSALADLERASRLITEQPDQVEEDGLPNAAGIPTSTLHTNIWYHLGLTRYLMGDYRGARAAYHEGLQASTNPDMTVAFQYWLALTAKRLNDSAAVRGVLADVDPAVRLLENTTYHRLLLHFRGDLPADSLVPADSLGSLDNVTAAYGVAAWRMLNGDLSGASQLFNRIVQVRDQWPAFGYLAAEAELGRAAMAHAH